MGRKNATKVIKLTDEGLRRELSALEVAHGMTNEQFLERYNSGELGDDLTFIHWAGLLSIAAKVGLSTSISA